MLRLLLDHSLKLVPEAKGCWRWLAPSSMVSELLHVRLHVEGELREHGLPYVGRGVIVIRYHCGRPEIAGWIENLRNKKLQALHDGAGCTFETVVANSNAHPL